VSIWIWVAVAIVLVGWYLSWTAGRLDRLHARIDAARAALDAQLLRRSSAAQELATSTLLDPASSILLYQAAHAARTVAEDRREVAESDLSQALRAVFAEPEQAAELVTLPGGDEAVPDLRAATRRGPRAAGLHPAPRWGGRGGGGGAWPVPGGEEGVRDRRAATRRVPRAGRFHNDSVGAARAVRRHRIGRLGRLAGHAPFPQAFEMDDEPPAAL